MFKIKQYDVENYNQTIEIFLSDDRLILHISFFKESFSLGESQLYFSIENNKINWNNPTWINENTMKFCDKLLLMKAFI